MWDVKLVDEDKAEAKNKSFTLTMWDVKLVDEDKAEAKNKVLP